MELYLDCAATTKVDDDVLNKYLELLKNDFGSTGSLHHLGEIALNYENQARLKMASLLKVKPNEILFCSGATEANNFAIKGVAFKYQNRGKTIITSKVEHPSVLQCFEQLSKQYGFNCLYVDVDDNGIIDLKQLESYLSNDVILVSIMAVNHEVGSIMPIKEISNLLKKYPKIIFHSDITQALGKINLDLSLVDLASASAHKIHGLKGSGFLYKKEKIQLFELVSGHPARNALRAGTSPWQAYVTLPIALNKVLSSLNQKYQKLKENQIEIINRIKDFNNIVINTKIDYSIPNIVNFSVIGYNPEVIIRAMSSKNIYLSSRSVCSIAKKDQVSQTLYAMRKDMDVCISSIRVSFDEVLDKKQIDYFVNSLKEILDNIRK